MNLQNNIIFTGFVSTEEKTRLIATSQALVFPSLCEGFGLVILEAFEQKKPVLVSDIRPLSDIVTHKTTGLVLPPHDENEWTKAFTEIISTPEDFCRMGCAGREVLESQYNVSKMNFQVLKMYDKVIRGGE